jgi:hypothetical protein
VDTDEAVLQWHQTSKESVWHQPTRNLYVELHTRPMQAPLLIPTIGLDSPLQPVTLFSGFATAVLADEELFAYLCVHGTFCGWHRLKWLADLAAWLTRFDAGMMESLYRRSIALGGGRSAAISLLLCQEVLGTAVPEALVEELRRDWQVRLLVGLSKRMLSGHGATERRATALGFEPARVIPLLLLPGWRPKAKEVVRQVMEPADREFAALPRPLRPAALPLLLPAYLVRQVKRISSSVSAAWKPKPRSAGA